ncbi:uncharacterized protein [Nerophis lumbriciformis]|uniref:uncharacterized protein isoform X2 n=1 Tax=Nerophis lumbriciformis TaxID=546530 RepID=UPI003BAA6DAA
MQTTNSDQSTPTSSSSTETEVTPTLPPKTTGVTDRTETTQTNLKTTQPSLSSTEPSTTATSLTSEPQFTTETTVTFGESTPNDVSTESTSLNTKSSQTEPTSQEPLTSELTSSSESKTTSVTTIMPTDSTESNTSPETSTTVGTMQTTNNDQSTATSSSSTETEVSATLPPKTTGFTETSAEYRTDTAVTNLETTQPSVTSTEPLTTVFGSTPFVTQPTSTSEKTSDSPSTPECNEGDCQCQAGECKYSVELRKCHCFCPDNIYGDTCSYGQNNTSPDIDTGAIPTRKADITLDIKITFLDAYNNLSSPESLDFITKLQKELEPLCNQAEPEAFEKVQVVKLSPGSSLAARLARGLYQDTKVQSANALIKKIKSLLKKANSKVEVVALSPSSVAATSRAEYSYQNNVTQIQWLNTHLDDNLAQILKENISLVSQAFSNASVQFKEVVSAPIEIHNITDLQSFINCSKFVNYTSEVVGDQWQCVGPCKRWPDYCSAHGECLNDINKGALCRCSESSIRQYYGQRCQLYRWGPGFYGALFGSIAVFLLLLTTILVVFLLKKRHCYSWKINRVGDFLDFEEDYFDFTDTGIDGIYTPEPF